MSAGTTRSRGTSTASTSRAQGHHRVESHLGLSRQRHLPPLDECAGGGEHGDGGRSASPSSPERRRRALGALRQHDHGVGRRRLLLRPASAGGERLPGGVLRADREPPRHWFRRRGDRRSRCGALVDRDQGERDRRAVPLRLHDGGARRRQVLRRPEPVHGALARHLERVPDERAAVTERCPGRAPGTSPSNPDRRVRRTASPRIQAGGCARRSTERGGLPSFFACSGFGTRPERGGTRGRPSGPRARPPVRRNGRRRSSASVRPDASSSGGFSSRGSPRTPPSG